MGPAAAPTPTATAAALSAEGALALTAPADAPMLAAGDEEFGEDVGEDGGKKRECPAVVVGAVAEEVDDKGGKKARTAEILDPAAVLSKAQDIAKKVEGLSAHSDSKEG